jgi:hypothetical protein
MTSIAYDPVITAAPDAAPEQRALTTKSNVARDDALDLAHQGEQHPSQLRIIVLTELFLARAAKNQR